MSTKQEKIEAQKVAMELSRLSSDFRLRHLIGPDELESLLKLADVQKPEAARPATEDCPPLTDDEMARLLAAFESPMKPVSLSESAVVNRTGMAVSRLRSLGVIVPSERWRGLYMLAEALR